MNPRAQECKSIVDPHPKGVCAHTHTYTSTDMCMHAQACILTQKHRNTPLPQFDSKYCPISASAPFFLLMPSLVPIPTLALLTGGGAGPGVGLVSTALTLNKGETLHGGGAQLRACPLHPPPFSPLDTQAPHPGLSTLAFDSQRDCSLLHIPTWGHGPQHKEFWY